MYDPTTGLQLRLMGVPDVRLNSVPLTFSRRRALALLAYLAVTGHVHSRDVLATLLSGDAPESQARKRLSNALTELRQLVGDYVITTRDTAAFNSDLPWWTDVHAFRTSLANSLEDEGYELLQQAVDLFHEEFLPGLTVSEACGFDEWVMLQGEALRTQAVQALQTIVARAIRQRANAAGITAARRLVSLEPWFEDAHRQLMILLARVGQRQEALAQFEICRSILLDELGEEPAPDTLALYNRLKTPHVSAPSGLPVPASPLVGRESELLLLTNQLSDPSCRLITLVGLGGIGKSRLALQCAHAIADAPGPAEERFPDGVFFLPLDEIAHASPIDDEMSVARRLIESIGATVGCGSSTSSDAAENPGAALASKALLVVLDGADHLPATAITTITKLLVSCPKVTILTTSREPLLCSDEHVMVVGSLRVPSRPEEVEQAPASRMLLMEAQRARLGFALRDEDRPHVVQLCRLVGGMPLALMMLAPYLSKLESANMVAELESTLDMLTSTDSRLVESHRSMGAVLRQAWERLSDEDRRVVRGLSIFPGGFDSAAVRDVVTCSVPHFGALMDLGIIERGRDGRYVLHALLRRQGSRELGTLPQEAEELRQRYSRYFADLVESSSSRLGQSREAIQILRQEHDNIRNAWQSAIDQGAWHLLGQMCDGITSYFSASGLFREGAALLGDAAHGLRGAITDGDVPNLEVQRLLGRVLIGHAALQLRGSQYDRTERSLVEASEIGNAIGSTPLQAHVQYLQGLLCASRSRYADARAYIGRALKLTQDAQLRSLELECRLAMSELGHMRGDVDWALEQVQQITAEYAASGDTGGEIASLTHLGIMAVERGNCEQGRLALEHAGRLLCETGDESVLESALLSAFGLLYAAMGCYAEAERDHTRALHINRVIGWQDAVAVQPILGEGGSLLCLGRVARIQGDVATARRHLSEALKIYQYLGSCRGEALALVELSLLEHVENRHRPACQLADHALSLLDGDEHRQLRRFALLALGHAEFDLGHLTEAAAVYAHALVLDRAWGNRWRVIESTIDLARVALAKEDRIRASALLAPVLNDVLSGGPLTIDEPARAYLTVYQILHSIGDPRDRELLKNGHWLVRERTETITDDMRHPLSLPMVSANRDLLRVGNDNRLQRDVVTAANS